MNKRACMTIAVLALASCQKPAASTEKSPATVTFQFLHASHGERFKLRTSNPALIEQARAELEKPMKERILHPTGTVVRGDGGVNAPWSWSLDERDWSLAQISAEVCDGWPGYVEEHLDEWIASPGSFCPWQSRLEKELN